MTNLWDGHLSARAEEFVAKHGHDRVLAICGAIMGSWRKDNPKEWERQMVFLESNGLILYLDEYFSEECLGVWDSETVGKLDVPRIEE